MSPLGLLVVLVAAGLLFALPRRWSILPLLIGAAYIPFSQELEIGPLHFTGIRVLVAVGLLKAMSRGERLAGGINSLDKLMFLWGGWFVFASVFHQTDAFITRLGEVFTDLGSYFLCRIYLRDREDLLRLFKMTCLVLVPLAAVLLLEKMTRTNYFGVLFGGWTEALVRNGHVRAQGPFEHPILAGTVGAISLPMAFCLWRQDRKLALIGAAAAGGIVVASASSGPVLTVFSAFGALALWKIRNRLRAVRWAVVFLLVVLNFVMSDPVYFLVARIDISGGSTGWYRAQLIRSAIEHFDQWWLAGTDFTRDWMTVVIDQQNTDITNYYIRMGVWGGLPLMVIFIAILCSAFAAVGRALRASEDAPFEEQFRVWTLGAILFAHCTTFFAVSYFDQTVVFFLLLLAAIGSLAAAYAKPACAPVEIGQDEITARVATGT